MHPTLENARKEIWERPDENGRKGQRPKSVDQLLGKSKWDMPLCDWIYYLFIYFISFNVREPWRLCGQICDWIMATGVGLLGSRLRDLEAERLEKNDGWRREPFIWVKLFTLGTDVGGGVVCISISFPLSVSFSFYFTVMPTSFPFIDFLNQWGLIPRMGKTNRWGRRTVGGLIFFVLFALCSWFYSSVIC
jgi:hypothetical protein